MLALFILVPLGAVMLLNLLPYWLRRGAFFGVAVLAAVQVAAVFVPAVMQNHPVPGLTTVFAVNLGADELSRIMLLCIGIVMLIVLPVGRHVIRAADQRLYFTSLLLLSLAGLNGVVLVRDVFSLYVYWEVAAAAAFVLIALEQGRRALEGAFKYFIFSSVATVLVLAAIALLLLISGDTSLAAVKAALQASPHSLLIVLAIGVFLAGLFMKAGVVPFHGYLPDAYAAASAPVSILLAGIITKTLGVYTAMRVMLDVFGFSAGFTRILLVIGLASAILAGFAALGQKDFKRLLAYSSISQMGYIFLGFACGTALGSAAAIFHLFNHTIFKSLLFVNAAAVEDRARTHDMEQLGGLAQAMPVTGTTAVLASLSTAGVPPLAGFWSKLLILLALWRSGHYGYAVAAALASVITLAYMLRMQRRVFFGTLRDALADVTEAGFSLTLPAIVLAIITVGTGVFFPFIVHTVIFPLARP